MANLQYRGAAAAVNNDLSYPDYITAIRSDPTTGDLNAGAVTARINSGLSSYADVTYMKNQDATLATQTYIDDQDKLRVRLTDKEMATTTGPTGRIGVAALNSTGRVSGSRLNVSDTQKWNKGPWAPSSYSFANTGITTESGLYQTTIADPGYTYRLIVFGQLDAHSGSDSVYPIVCVRANSSSGEVIAQGQGASDAAEALLLGDDFEGRDGDDIDPGVNTPILWSANYTGPGANEVMIGSATPFSVGGQAFMPERIGFDSNQTTAVLCQRVEAATRYTGTNFQHITARMGTLIPQGRNSGSNYPYLRLYFRMNDSRTQYVAWEISDQDVRLVYANGGSESTIGPVTSVSLSANTDWHGYAGEIGGGVRRFYLYKGSTLISQIDDSSVTAFGVNNRGWGFGMRQVPFGIGQFRAPSLDSIYISDSVSNYEPVNIIPLNLENMTPRTGTTDLYVRMRSSNLSTSVYPSTYMPKLHVMAVPA